MVGFCVAYLDVTNQEAYGKYSSQAPGVIEKFGGRIRVRGGRSEMLEGPAVPDRIILLEFDSRTRAESWYNSAEYREISKDRVGAANLWLTVVEAEQSEEAPENAGYIIVKANIRDREAIGQYVPAAHKTLVDFGGTMIANGPATSLEGEETYQHMVILRFATLDDRYTTKIECK